MNNYGFHFAGSYQGYWNIAQIGRKIPGTLYLEKHSIRLELFWNNVTHVDLHVIPSATGYAYTDIENKKTSKETKGWDANEALKASEYLGRLYTIKKEKVVEN